MLIRTIQRVHASIFPMQQMNTQPLQYTKTHRIIESVGLLLYSLLTIWSVKEGVRVAGLHENLPWILLFLGGAVLGDFVAGMVHWAADTWGTEQTPLFGGWLIRSFREHHTDPLSITRHDFVETNGAVAVGLSPLLFAYALYLPTEPTRLQAILFILFNFFSLMILLTNQIHKWSHQEKQPLFVRFLQKTGFALSPTHHSVHHSGIFDSHYCITMGWMNPILDKLGYFRRLERLITRVTGFKPRDY